MSVPLKQQTEVSVTADSSFDKIVERLGELVEAELMDDALRLIDEHPEQAPRLRQLLPAIEALASFDELTDGPTVTANGPSKGVLGDFRIVREIGRGGMGVVYEAQQISLNRRVALKVLPLASMLDVRRLERFRHEAQAAAMLRHPHIVTVYSVGCERGVHYYAMDYIEGLSLAEVVEKLKSSGEERGARSEQIQSEFPSSQPPVPSPHSDTRPIAALSTLKTTQPAEFFRSVARIGIQAAEALDYAHQMGVVHRDIKPSNLLLDTAGKLWITDFGLAMTQSDAGLTMTGDLLGTLRYMSPEQAAGKRMPLDHRTDVYSLGMTLYELLAGRPVFDTAERGELLRAIADVDPLQLRKIDSSIPADLETIVHKAIEKDPADRFRTARELADDLQRHIVNEPIKARPATLLQRTVKWSRRHAAVVTSASLLFVVSTVVLSVASIQVGKWYREAEHQRQLASAQLKESQKQEQTALAVSNLLLDMLRSADPDSAKGADYTVREALNDFCAELDQHLADQPEVEAELRATIGKAYSRLGLSDQAEFHLESALEILREERGANHLSVGDCLVTYARHMCESGRDDEAIQYLGDAIANYRRNGSPVESMVQALWILQRCFLHQQRFTEAEAAAEEALKLIGNIDSTQIADVASIIRGRSDTKRKQGEYVQAEALARRALKLHRRLHGEQHLETGWALCTLGRALLAQTKLAEAETTFREAVAIFRHAYASHSGRVAYPIVKLTEVLRARGGRPAVLQFWEEQSRLYPYSSWGLSNLASVLVEGVDVNVHDLHRVVELTNRSLELNPLNGAAEHALGVAYYRLGEYHKSTAAFRRGVEVGNANGSDWFCLALAEWRLGRHRAARSAYGSARRWTEENDAPSELVAYFRAEAAKVRGAEAHTNGESAESD